MFHEDYTMPGGGVGVATASNSEYALKYADMGWQVFPLAPRSKLPLKGSHGKNDATSDRRQVESWWEKMPDAGIGVVPEKSGLLVTDFDPKNGGLRFLEKAKRQLGWDVLDTVPRVWTGSGEQWYFAAPTGKVGNMSPVRGLDVFGDVPGGRKGHVVAPRSIHPDGPVYEWENPPAWDEPSLPPLMPELAELLTEISVKWGKAEKPEVESEPEPETTVAEEVRASALRQYDRDERFLREWCGFMGISVKPEKAFRSPLRKDAHPSCSLHKASDGAYRYHDFAMNGKLYYSLAQVYGAKVTGKAEPLPPFGRFEFAVWQTRMLVNLGFLPRPARVNIRSLPTDAPKSAQVAWEGFRLLLETRSVGLGEVRPAPYSYGFCERWTGLSNRAVREGMKWLRDHGYLRYAGKAEGSKDMGLYLPYCP